MGMDEMEKLEKIHKYIIELKSQNKKQSEEIKELKEKIKELEDKYEELDTNLSKKHGYFYPLLIKK
jgi:peptidoglycan hydrolase CwlO-like protein